MENKYIIFDIKEPKSTTKQAVENHKYDNKTFSKIGFIFNLIFNKSFFLEN